MSKQKGQPDLGFASAKKDSGPVECLGQTFENDVARREHYLGLLAEKLKDPEFRKTPGFPQGTDEAILRISDPPYYTACPNPFIEDFVQMYGRPYDPNEVYSRRPYAFDVSQSRNNEYVNAHSYATKVPPLAVLRYILHYTQPGDIVFDGYCGTAMAAVAAQIAASPPSDLRCQIEEEWNRNGRDMPKWGGRPFIANDLSPAATFIGSNLTANDDLVEFEATASRLLEQVERKCGWMYKTKHSNGKTADIDAVIWSDVFICPECSVEVVFWDAAVDIQGSRVRDEFACSSCGTLLKKRGLTRAYVSRHDPVVGGVVRLPKQTPVAIVYYIGTKKYEKKPDDDDHALLNRIEEQEIADWYPSIAMMNTGANWGDTWRSGYHAGITHLHQLFTKRNLHSLACAWSHATSNRLRFMLTALMYKSSTLCGPLMSNYFAEKHGKNRGGWIGKERSGTLFRPSICSEVPIHKQIKSRMGSVAARARANNALCLQTSSIEASGVPDDSVDYVFTDPPFGANRYYSELNFLWEAWLGIITDNASEAVESPAQGKDLAEYQRLMESGFAECFRILKPGRWITVEFSNTRAAVWNAIQLAMSRAGFVVADVRGLSKGQGSINAYTTPTAVKQDLVISAYKPARKLHEDFQLGKSSESDAWAFVHEHLEKLPVFVASSTGGAVVAERTPHMLHDRMVSFFVQHMVTVPINAIDFFAGLDERFPVRDGMYFLHGQVTEYDRKRTTVSELRQLELFVSDEASATQWIRQQLHDKPQSFQDLQPQFMQQLQSWAKHEKTIELKEILELNFFCYDGNGPVPSQIHRYLSTNFRAFRNLDKDDADLKAKAVGRWYVPDPNKEGDLDKLRLRTLLKEFEAYRTSTARKIKEFRTEAVRAGFKHCYDDGDYQTIADVAAKLPEQIIQEDEKLLMYYDVATMRLGD